MSGCSVGVEWKTLLGFVEVIVGCEKTVLGVCQWICSYSFPLQSTVVFLVGTVGSSVLCMSIPYSSETLPAKVGAFAVFTSVMGASLTPLLFIGG